jgi:predicted ribosome quality control (RQC) complex YloA/Tae2 family protein
LTYKEFAAKVKDLFEHEERVTMRDIELLKLGRHFRFGAAKLIVGRNESENSRLLELKEPAEYAFEVPEYGSPITILQGTKTAEAIELAARLTARYSDARADPVVVEYWTEGPRMRITVSPLKDEELARLKL